MAFSSPGNERARFTTKRLGYRTILTGIFFASSRRIHVYVDDVNEFIPLWSEQEYNGQLEEGDLSSFILQVKKIVTETEMDICNSQLSPGRGHWQRLFSQLWRCLQIFHFRCGEWGCVLSGPARHHHQHPAPVDQVRSLCILNIDLILKSTKANPWTQILENQNCWFVKLNSTI